MPPTSDPPIPFDDGVYFVKEGHAPPDFCVAAANTVAHICATTTDGDILVYAPGAGEIETIITIVKRMRLQIDASPLFSAMPTRNQHESRVKRRGKNRKCLVATDLALGISKDFEFEYIIDTGLKKLMIYNPRLNMYMLEVRPASRRTASDREQRGASREQTCIKLYSKSVDMSASSEQETEHLNKSAARDVLRLLARGITNLAYHSWGGQPPHPDTLARAVQDLFALDLVEENGQLTATGRAVSLITDSSPEDMAPLEPSWALAIHEASRLGCVGEVIIIAALCSLKSTIFQEHSGMEAIAGIIHAKFADGPSDHLRLLNAYLQYRRVNALDGTADDKPRTPDETETVKVWCKLHFLNLDALEAASFLVRLIKKRVREKTSWLAASNSDATVVVVSDASKDARILKAITRGFAHQTAIYEGVSDKYCTVETNVTALLHDKSAVVGVRPQWVVYTQLLRRSRRYYLDNVSVVDPDWLLDLKNLRPDALLPGRDGSVRQPRVMEALEAARAKQAASTKVRE